MKNVFKLKIVLLALAVLTVIGSCELEPETYGSLTPQNFPNSDEDFEASVTDIYRDLMLSWAPLFLDNSQWMMNILPTDELRTAWGDGWQSLDRLEWTPETGSVESNFTRYVRSITKATLLIGNLEEAPIEKGDFENRIIAEAKTLRAFYAFNLLDLFGPVPIIVDYEEAKSINSETKPERPTEDWMVNFITMELNAVIPNLPASYPNEDFGRVTKGAALTMLMKLQLHEKDWQGVLNSTQQIMGLGYQLMPTYESVFDWVNEGASNTETILAIPKLAQNDLAHSWFAACLPQTPEYKSPTGIKYSLWGGLKTPWTFYDKFEEGTDLRLSRMIRYYEDIDGNMVDFRAVQNDKAIGAAPKKYGDDPEQIGFRQGNDVILYRYADVLLARAEAMNEVSGPNAEAIDLINQIRTRAGVSEISVGDFTKDTLRDFILDERGRELWCEGSRRQDLIRHGKFISTAEAEGYNPGGDHLKLYPIPQSARNENPKIGQNPGY